MLRTRALTCTDTTGRSRGHSRGRGRWRSASRGTARTAALWSGTGRWWLRATSPGEKHGGSSVGAARERALVLSGQRRSPPHRVDVRPPHEPAMPGSGTKDPRMRRQDKQEFRRSTWLLARGGLPKARCSSGGTATDPEGRTSPSHSSTCAALRPTHAQGHPGGAALPFVQAAGVAGPADPRPQTLCAPPPPVVSGAAIRGPTFTPAKMPVVDTLKSRYASTSGEGGLNTRATFFFGMSSAGRRTLCQALAGHEARFLPGRPSRHLRAAGLQGAAARARGELTSAFRGTSRGADLPRGMSVWDGDGGQGGARSVHQRRSEPCRRRSPVSQGARGVWPRPGRP